MCKIEIIVQTALILDNLEINPYVRTTVFLTAACEYDDLVKLYHISWIFREYQTKTATVTLVSCILVFIV